MATKGKGKAKGTAKKDVKIIGIPDLCEEFGMEGTRIRTIIRSLDIHAPKIEGVTGFGPRAKYAWPEDSDELAKIREALAEKAEAAADAKKEKAKKDKAKKKVEKPAPVEEEDEDEDEDDEDEDDDDDEDDEE